MRSSKCKKSHHSLQGKILVKSKKLTIEVPEEDDDPMLVKLNKNSPKYSKIATETKKSTKPSITPKTKTPSSTKAAKRCYGDSGTPRISSKLFSFTSASKVLKRSQAKINKSIPHKNKSKGLTPVSKNTFTPTQRNISIDSKKRPKTATNCDKNFLKPETGSSPSASLNSIVTQVKLHSPRNLSAIPTEDLMTKSEVLYKEHLFQTFQAMKFVKSLQPVNLEQLKEKRVNVPKRQGYEGKKTLIFDLDETLVHCCEDATKSNPMVVLPIVFPTGEVVQAGMNIRPYALECLREVNKYFEVFVFTASHPCYANVVLDYLDPEGELIHHRFFRDSCINTGGVFIKDLRIIGNRNLKDMIIVDNAAYSFGYQLDNGIPIVSWHDDPFDKELYNLIDYVQALAAVDDIRDVNEQTFHLRTFYEDYISEFLVNESVMPNLET